MCYHPKGQRAWQHFGFLHFVVSQCSGYTNLGIPFILSKVILKCYTLECFPGGSDSKKVLLQCGRPGFNPWVEKISWKRAWQPTPVFLPGQCPWTEEPGELQSVESQRVRHDRETKHSTYFGILYRSKNVQTMITHSFFFFFYSQYWWIPNIEKQK